MHGVANTFSNLPGPVKVLLLIGSGAGVGTAVMSVADPNTAIWRIIFIGILCVAIAIALYVLFLKMREKGKSRPFASLLSRGGGAAADAAMKAQIDDLRKKFEEGVDIYRRAGKDLYSLPWYLLVGPSGSGKTEAMRHCNVGFPPGLQDALQGTGGTINMHWWFTNQAVVLDTAGRMFMQDVKEWREFLKLLKRHRPHCPINGMLLVISAESLLTDSADKIEATARTIAQRFGEMQTDLDVRFPVFVLVTKCDKITGFREFFETITDPVMQHQILGWSNPAGLDEPFKPEEIERHLDSVRGKLMKRRMGLLQNPVHTIDPEKRRTDQVDELFELPDNLMRIAPRLKRYLELIFVAGEWSPKPLFFRGIYFTSSMREGHALDVTLAQALGVDVEAVAGEATQDKEKAYFLRDVFVQKTFKEKGLVTRATNVGKSIARQRGILLGASAAAVLIAAGIAVIGWMDFSGSVKKPGRFWTGVSEEYAKDGGASLDLIGIRDGQLSYLGGDSLPADSDLLSREGDPISKRATVIVETGNQADTPIKAPLIAMPVAASLGFGDGFITKQVVAHRALVETTVLEPLFLETGRRLRGEQKWGPEAVAALAQMIAVETYAAGGTPANIEGAPVDVEALFRYVLPDDQYRAYQNDSRAIVAAVAKAYPDGVEEPKRFGAAMGAGTNASRKVVTDAVASLKDYLRSGGASGGPIAVLRTLSDALGEFARSEQALWALQWLKDAAARPNDNDGYATFESRFTELVDAIDRSRANAEGLIADLPGVDVMAVFADGQKTARERVAAVFARLRGGLPAEPIAGSEIEPLRAAISSDVESQIGAAVAEAIDGLGRRLNEQIPLFAQGKVGDAERRAFVVRSSAYRSVTEQMRSAAEPPREVRAFGAATADVLKQSSEPAGAIKALADWTPAAGAIPASSGDPAAIGQARESALAATRNAMAIVASRRIRTLADAFLQSAPATADDAARQVSLAAEFAVADNSMPRWTVPTVPMSGVTRETTFDIKFHPQAAAAFLNDWLTLRSAVESSGQGAMIPLIGRDEIRGQQAYRVGITAAEDYARQYAGYWSGDAMGLIRPSVADWREFAEKVPRSARIDVKGELTAFQQRAGEALAQIPAPLTNAPWFRAAQEALAGAFSAIERDEFHTEAQQQLDAWRTLSTQPAGVARDTLLAAIREGRADSSYFLVYRPSGARILWWNQFTEAGVAALVNATQSELRDARTRLINESRGIPLVRGGADPRDLTPEEVAQVLRDASLLRSAVSNTADPATARAAPAGTPLADLLRQLSGADLLAANQRDWLTRLEAAATMMSQPQKVTVVYDATPPAVPAGTPGSDARNRYRYAGLRIDGQPQGDTYNIATGAPVPDALRERLVAQIPAAANATVQITLYVEQPSDPRARPDAVITMPGAWGPVRALLTAADGGAAYDAESKEWRVLGRTEDGNHYLWIRLGFEKGVPAGGEWPEADNWPR